MGNGRRIRRHHKPERPPWEVVLVGEHVGGHCSNPDCTEKHDLPADVGPSVGFGYTVGLFDEFDLPELHLSAYPSEGEAPPLAVGAVGDTLNHLAEGCIVGALQSGGRYPFPLCEHRTMVLTFGQPGPLEEVSAFQCSDGAECIPVKWHVEGLEPAGI